jgi:hypothetical protein
VGYASSAPRKRTAPSGARPSAAAAATPRPDAGRCRDGTTTRTGSGCIPVRFRHRHPSPPSSLPWERSEGSAPFRGTRERGREARAVTPPRSRTSAPATPAGEFPCRAASP